MKNFIIKSIVLIFIVSLVSSCGGWTKGDEKKYLLECERAKLSEDFCQCTLGKITTKYTSFENAMQNENEFIEIFKACKK